MVCVYIPTVKNSQGIDVDSKLFRELTSYLGNRGMVVEIYNRVKTKAFQEFVAGKEGVKYDENGEITLGSLNSLLNLQSLKQNSDLRQEAVLAGAKDSQGNTIEYTSYNEVNSKVINYNKNSTSTVAYAYMNNPINRTYSIEVEGIDNSNASLKHEIVMKDALNDKIVKLLNRLGFDVGTVGSSDAYAGIFNPLEATRNADGLLEVIKLAKGEKGRLSLPEEFAHLVIRGLKDRTLVDRAIALISRPGVIETILGEDYDRYNNLYKGDTQRLAEEALGKLLADKLTEANEFKIADSLLSRVWNFAKSLFGKATDSEVADIIGNINDLLHPIAENFHSGDIVEAIDSNNVLKGDFLASFLNNTEHKVRLAERAVQLVEAKINARMKRSRNSRLTDDEIRELKALRKSLDENKHYDSSMSFLQIAGNELGELLDKLKEMQEDLKKGHTNNLNTLKYQSRVLREINEFKMAYAQLIEDLSAAEVYANQEITDAEGNKIKLLDVSDSQAQSIAETALALQAKLNNVEAFYKSNRFSVVHNFLSMFAKNLKGFDKLGVLEQMMRKVEEDNGFFDRWINSLDMNSDAIIQIVNQAIKFAKYSRDAEIEEKLRDLKVWHNKLRDAGYTDTSFAYDYDENGVPTGKYLSNIDWKKYYEARQAERERLIQLHPKNKLAVEAELLNWEGANTEVIATLDPITGMEERVPKHTNGGPYYSGKLDRSGLSDIQKQYIQTLIEFKRDSDAYLVGVKVDSYTVPMVRKDFAESAFDGSDLKTKYRVAVEKLREEFTFVEDEVEYGELGDLDEESEAMVKSTVALGLDGKPLRKVPIYFRRRLKDRTMLSTDATSAMQSYIMMAQNFSHMSDIADLAELTKDIVSERKVQQYSGNTRLHNVYRVLGNKTVTGMTIDGGAVAARLDDYLEQHIYGRKKKVETVEIGGKSVNVGKAMDSVRSLSSTLTLGLNFLSATSNYLMGRVNIFLEGNSGEFYTKKDARWAEKEYFSLLKDYVAELNSTSRTSKLALLEDLFNPRGTYFQEKKHDKYYHDALTRFSAGSTLQFMHSAGEHYLSNKVMLSMLKSHKVMLDGQTISLYDAYEVEQGPNGTAKLVLKKGVKNLDGTEFKENMLGADGNMAHSDLFAFKAKLERVSKGINGGYADEDKGAANKYVAVRMIMQFRQWMPEHFGKRFSKEYYDAGLGQYKEGYYVTSLKFLLDVAKGIRQGNFSFATSYKHLSEHQKANLRRAYTESGVLLATLLIIKALGGIEDDDNDGSWIRRFILYNAYRLKLELLSSMPTPTIVSNLMGIVKSPAASLDRSNKILQLLWLWDLNDTVESGRYKGHSEYYRNAIQMLPGYSLKKAVDLADEDYMFAPYTRHN